MTIGHPPKPLQVNLLDFHQACGMFFALICSITGFGVLAAVKEINDVAAHAEVVLLVSGCVLIISGIYHTSLVVRQISDPHLFLFYNKLSMNKYKVLSEDLSVLMVACAVLLLSALIWTFMYSTDFSDTLFAGFATSAIIPFLAMSFRIRARLNLYRLIYSTEEEHFSEDVEENVHLPEAETCHG